MENYIKASKERYADVNTLLDHSSMRTTAAAHLGGIAVECHIKAMVLNYHNIKSWGEEGKRPRDVHQGKPIQRPGHGLISIVKLMPRLYEKAKSDPQFLRHLNALMHPAGSSDIDFIALRYAANSLDSSVCAAWQQSLNYVQGWLNKNTCITK